MSYLKPFFNENNIPIILSSDNNYVKYLSVTIQSIIETSSLNYNYDIIILSDSITPESEELINSQITNITNFSIRFFDINTVLSKIDTSIFYTNQWFSIATYFRIYIPLIIDCYTKCLYIDCDLIVNSDIAELYHTDITNYYLGASQEIGIESTVTADSREGEYYIKTLGVKDNKSYFQAGVLLFNITKLKEYNLQENFYAMLKKNPTPRHVDQCIMNALFSDNYKKLPLDWNFVPGYFWNELSVNDNLSAETQKEYSNASYNPKIIHFTGALKPWMTKSKAFTNYFWKYAANSPYFSTLSEDYTYETSKQTKKVGILFLTAFIRKVSSNYAISEYRFLGLKILQIKVNKFLREKTIKFLYITIYNKKKMS